ncbi:MAG TPA: DNA mismatch repair endonuclease MutL [Patescibacteria group bacterium]
MKIIQLPPQIIAKIAAGEVIERPSFAVKELIENAIDAKATEISIHIEQAGLKKIQVIDNGTGMDKDDLLESIKPHTTSKLSVDDDLIGIKSLGFRGEALASLASVSHVIIKTRTKTSSSGNQLEIKNGKVLSVSLVGTPIGTNIAATNLFNSVPARKKFLKSTQTEFRHIVEVVTNYALFYPKIHFVLTHNKKTVLDLPKETQSNSRIEKLLGQEIMQYSLPVKKEEQYLKLWGFVTKPQLSSKTQNKQFIFVNNRRVSDKLISTAVKEAFSTMLEPTSYPIFILFLDIPFEMVDVNVHPRKEQVAFINSKFIFETIKQVITHVLSVNNITFQSFLPKKIGADTTTSYAGRLLKETVLEKESLIPTPSSPIVQLHKVYIVTQTKDGVLFIDQHAAHERILFEKLVKEFKQQTESTSSFPLPKPIPLSLPIAEIEIIRENSDFFNKLGFMFIDKGNKVAITHVPALFKDRNPKQLLQNMVDTLQEDLPLQAIDTVSLEMLSFLACRAAIKLGDKLTLEQMEKVISELEKSPNNATCPHGRPTKIVFPLKNISRLFKRAL